MADIVIREVTSNIWTFSRPFARFGLVPIGGRSTAIKLKGGEVWVICSTPLSEETKTAVNNLGPVKYLVAPNIVHNIFLTEWKGQYPEASVIGVAGLPKKKPGLKFDGVYGESPSDTLFGYESEIKACYFPGHANHDTAFFHVESRTLLEADLLLNLPAKEQYSKSKTSSKVPLFGTLNPFDGIHKRFVNQLGKDKNAMKRDSTTVAGWDFDRIIPCHGDVIETDGKKAWETLYANFL
ncbi:hypothetical protein SISNIDRAFT_450259 [Sistotremastrum niveocremeum HHB9708]|uniref:DUF4336 domain-containing protein n=1 Tax=Sistotremastrum niveocremeum HHB9708 TaxID=1314777 RepID=A0A164Z1N1_9AGAM|nr:hypothetical protein SISNIDRAFT_450259 [Sistotremastrum niveocremeum HHB9708]